mmetsp:Transcript_10850/g.14774  ORF Transcript_10850/g.14774 Transcript_10850/m.14774 type:complete len:331 (-) Transcript_10850:60-1052(-)|eukprot:CAMPEP_0196588844 /NCGR_PEP_ID=MMETSP1081-20130531/61892_1 /TAXON_ID=36882 /ORGANISM="Pyramimonas amylifera, Strain CCMP720" /LENGTH=330 /DNA_ID=CAMNT_0041911469 /DNA_START=146 /DNA_END=1138 /DNA_ORIENTATION=+
MKRTREEQVADHYSSRENQSRKRRQVSPIYHLRLLNNWLKSVLINEYTGEEDLVFDLGCGKGGDLPKWDKIGIGYYFGVDIAKESVKEHARKRYNDGNYRFPAQLMAVDAFQTDLRPLVPHCGHFDVVSCQFAFHYCFMSETRARTTLSNVAALLRPGGCFIGTTLDANILIKRLRAAPGLTFGNAVHQVSFSEKYSSKQFPSAQPFGVEYEFTLQDAVDAVPEYLVPFSVLETLALEAGLRLHLRANFHDYATLSMTNQTHFDLLQQMKVLGKYPDVLSEDEWETSGLYYVFAFKKIGTPEEIARGLLRRPEFGPSKKIEVEDVQVIEP